MNTYKTAEEGVRDKAQLKELLTALNGANRALCLDDCVAWQILGKRGNIYTWGDGKDFVLYVGCHSGQAWTWMKKRLHFCRVTQDCDEEGCLRLDHLPNAEEAESIREAIGLRQTRPAPANAFLSSPAKRGGVGADTAFISPEGTGIATQPSDASLESPCVK